MKKAVKVIYTNGTEKIFICESVRELIEDPAVQSITSDYDYTIYDMER